MAAGISKNKIYLVGLGLLYFILLIADCYSFEDVLNEELLIKPLPSGNVYAHFQFTTKWDIDILREEKLLHYNLFPKTLGQVINKYSVQELHLSLTQSIWRSNAWGYPAISAPPGAEIWVWFKKSTKNVDEAWAGLVNALSGQFCASLNFIDSTTSIQPTLSFRPEGLLPDGYPTDSRLLRYASLPRENVCTENLTPWKKLLPCTSMAGLGTLLQATHLYNANYHSLAVHVRPVCRDTICSQSSVELSQSLALVIDPTLSKLQKSTGWSLRNMFGKNIQGGCPLATTSVVMVDVSMNSTSNLMQLSPNPTEVIFTTRGGDSRKYAVYDLHKQEGKLNIEAKMLTSQKQAQATPPAVYGQKYLTGYGQEKGGISCILHNNDPSKSLRTIYLDIIPWYMRLYLHTIKITNSVKHIKAEKLLYSPGKDRTKPYILEMQLTLPPRSTTTISIQFDKAFLKWTEHPPDANIGFYTSSAVISTMLMSADNITSPEHHTALLTPSIRNPRESEFFLRIYTEGLLVQLPTPDFSMPYNVICLTCTVVAIGFGSIHNLTTRQFIRDSEEDPGLKAKVQKFLSKLWKKKSNEKDESASKNGKTDEDDKKSEEAT
ncbi:GPI transamidase component PIG-T-like [Anneissia japonica]|uniref:GPI transamidase component PIG-T-like n=1 Tax=Anneissia japonica TaxID=1529436 RepID=UPI00142588FC|nr:GPI transamidase component PIG-T-like [Anneissia japonica]